MRLPAYGVGVFSPIATPSATLSSTLSAPNVMPNSERLMLNSLRSVRPSAVFVTLGGKQIYIVLPGSGKFTIKVVKPPAPAGK